MGRVEGRKGLLPVTGENIRICSNNLTKIYKYKISFLLFKVVKNYCLANYLRDLVLNFSLLYMVLNYLNTLPPIDARDAVLMDIEYADSEILSCTGKMFIQAG